MRLYKKKEFMSFDAFINQQANLLLNTQFSTHTPPNFISDPATFSARQSDPGLAGDPACCHIASAAESQHALEWHQSMPQHKEAGYLKAILPQLYPFSPPCLLRWCMPEGMAAQQSSWEIWCDLPKMGTLDSQSRPWGSALTTSKEVKVVLELLVLQEWVKVRIIVSKI